MTRQDAIDAIIATWLQRDGEFCVGAAELEDSRQEMVDVLHALGVTDAEIEGDKP